MKRLYEIPARPRTVEQLMAPPTSLIPGTAPGASSLTAVPQLYPAPGLTELAFLYGQLQALDTTVQTATTGVLGSVSKGGDTMTGSLVVNRATGATGTFLDVQLNAVSLWNVNNLGNTTQIGTHTVNMPTGSTGVFSEVKLAGSSRWRVDNLGSTNQTGRMVVNALPAWTGTLWELNSNGQVRAFADETGTMFVANKFQVGTNADQGVERFRVNDGTTTQMYFTSVPGSGSGVRGLHLNKPKTDTSGHGVAFDLDGIIKWEMGIDFDTNNAFGNSDFVLLNDHTAGIDDTGAGAGTDADIVRTSSAEQCTTFGQGPKFVIAYKAGTPRANPDFMLIEAGKNLGGMKVTYNSDNSKNCLSLVTRGTADNRVTLAYANASDAFTSWQMGMDLAQIAARAGWGFSLFDGRTTAAAKTRLFVEGTNNRQAKVGVNTNNPQGLLSVTGDANAANFNVIQTYFAGTWNDDLTNRTLSLQTILDASAVVNYLWLNGTLGSTSTRGTPTATSTNVRAYAWECTDNQLAIATAPNGANQTITRPFICDGSGHLVVGRSGGNLGFFGGAAIAKPALTAAATDLASVITLSNSIRTALQNLGLTS